MVSGLHKEPKFIAVGDYKGKPILCDDTCYLIPCAFALQASVLAAILNHPLTMKFIKSISFNDSKRPITKAVLSRIDIGNIALTLSIEDLSSEILNNLKRFDDTAELDAVPDDIILALGINNRPVLTELFSA